MFGVQTGVLGQGTFGMVIRATDPETDPPTDVAIKLLPRGTFIKNFKTYVKREILHQSSLKHPFIVSLREVLLRLPSLPVHVSIEQRPSAGPRSGDATCSVSLADSWAGA